ncbi:DUF192 domain-containing protein [Alphaproteobacteria bacterium]|nr:DUF192 domain-containing protein [Alphaproteobacteria bacterium]
MNNFKKTAFLVLFFFLTTIQVGCSEDATTFKSDEIRVQTVSHGTYNFEVELALTPAQQQQGLMHRESLDENKGMLFVFPNPSDLGFWMKNTLIPLDMIFIDKDGVVINVHSMAKPKDLTTVKSKGLAKAVLEINGGLAEKLGIVEGSIIIHTSFGNDF